MAIIDDTEFGLCPIFFQLFSTLPWLCEVLMFSILPPLLTSHSGSVLTFPILYLIASVSFPQSLSRGKEADLREVKELAQGHSAMSPGALRGLS